MSVVQEFNLDIIPQTVPVIIPVNQYDTGTGRLVIKLYDGLTPYSPSDATVKIQGTKPDKKGFEYPATISGNTVTADLELQMTACYGDVRTQIVVTESTGETGTFVFILRVQKSALEEDVDISETVLPDYIDAAERNAERAEAAVQHYPYIGANNHWYVWDAENEQFVDTGVNGKGQDGRDGIMSATVSGEKVTFIT